MSWFLIVILNKMMSKFNHVLATSKIKKILFFFLFLILVIYVFWQSIELGWLGFLKDQQALFLTIKELGVLGPVAIIFLIAIAIVVSPLPSAPIAVVSGALYGHTLGTIYVVVGSLLGALSAFFIARKLGRDYVNKKIQSHLPVKIVGSQNMLMLIVFVTRLAPFISFDVISYAAGLTKLTFIRFFIATLMGIIPVSFLLAHFGSEVENSEVESVTIAFIVLGLFIIVPMVVNVFKNKKMKD